MSHRMTVRDPAGKLLSFRLDHDAVSLGRNDGNDILLPYPFVSGRHLTIEVQGGTVFVKDLGSSNRTRLDGVPLEPHVFAAVRPGQTLEVGPLAIRFEPEPEASAPQEPGRPRAAPGDGSLLARPSMLWQLQTGLFPSGAFPAGGGEDLSATHIGTRHAFAPVPAAWEGASRPAPRTRRPAAVPRPLWLAVQVAAGLSVLASLVVLIVTLLL